MLHVRAKGDIHVSMRDRALSVGDNGQTTAITHLLLQLQHYCKQHGAHLVSIDSRVEDLFLKDFIARLKGTVYMSLAIRKPAFFICESKDADQLRGNREADQRLCFRYLDSAVTLLPKSEISSL